MNARFRRAKLRVDQLTSKAEYLYRRHWVENDVDQRWLANPLRNAIEEGIRARFSDNYTRILNAARELRDAIGPKGLSS